MGVFYVRICDKKCPEQFSFCMNEKHPTEIASNVIISMYSSAIKVSYCYLTQLSRDDNLQRNCIKSGLLRWVVISKGDQMKLFLGEKQSHLPFFIFESRSIMSSFPAVTFHQPACQAHSVQCAAKDSLSCESTCVKGLVFVFLIYSVWCISKHYYGLAKKRIQYYTWSALNASK